MKCPINACGKKIAVIGAGAVGSTLAYTLMLKNVVSEVIVVDINEQKKIGEVMDITDGLSFSETGTVEAADFGAAAGCDIIVITAGLPQKPGETRLDLVKKNKEIFRSIFNSIGPIKKDAIIIVVSNPVDVLTHLAQELSGLSKSRVFGSGTSLDTARLRRAVAEELGVYAQNVDGYMLGEHGDTEFAAWSTVTVGGIPISKFLKTKQLLAIEDKVRHEAYEIINRKGATFYGIAATVADIVEAILFNQHKVVPLSVHVQKWNGIGGLCIGVPAVVGSSGIERVWPLTLNYAERGKLKKSARIIQQYSA